jgi:hypothetical protein
MNEARGFAGAITSMGLTRSKIVKTLKNGPVMHKAGDLALDLPAWLA